MLSKNQIFYGPSHCGKSYHTIIESLRILGSALINPDKNYIYSTDEYNRIIEEFEYKRNIGEIEVISFHEAYSYTDFMEGSKINIQEHNNVIFKDKIGCFKSFAQKALFEYIDIPIEKTQNIFSFDKLITYFQELYPTGSTLKIESSIFEIIRYCQTSITIKPLNKSSMIEIKHSTLKNLIDKNSAHKILGNELKEILGPEKGNTAFYYTIFLKLDEIMKAAKISLINEFYKGAYQLKKNNIKNFVLIIEEIANCNLSKVFGELITLLDEDLRNKRMIQLPFSQEKFILPDNLYIIGTIATPEHQPNMKNYDILMRKFTFISLQPNENLVADFGCGFAQIFRSLNNRISILLGEDYQIGHGYFLKSTYENANINTLKELWFAYVYPRLKFYFKDDVIKLQSLLGNATTTNSSFLIFTEPTKLSNNQITNENKNIKLVPPNNEFFDFAAALKHAFEI